VDETEELRRVIDVVVGLAAATQIPISIDTSKACVAREAMAAGAAIVNDVTGLEADAEMVRVVREGEAGVVVMHMQGTPQTMQLNPTYENVVTEVREYLARRRDALVAAGIQSERIALDPGIGFGKTHEHNLSLLRHAGEFHQLGCPLLVGHSRKGFLAKVLGRKDSDRTAATIGVALALASQGVQILRVHDVRPVREALLLYDAVGGINGWETRWQ
jgi:dihydropteroate synthase